jgi:hypothetical protein
MKQELKKLAEAVKGWSNCNQAWLETSEDEVAAVVGHISEDGEKYPVTVVDCDQYYAGADSIKLAKFYAAASPDVVLGLLAEIEHLQKDFAYIKQRRDALTFALEKLARLGNGDRYGNSEGNAIAIAALNGGNAP